MKDAAGIQTAQRNIDSGSHSRYFLLLIEKDVRPAFQKFESYVIIFGNVIFKGVKEQVKNLK